MVKPIMGRQKKSAAGVKGLGPSRKAPRKMGPKKRKDDRGGGGDKPFMPTEGRRKRAEDYMVEPDLLYGDRKRDFGVLCMRYGYEKAFPQKAEAEAHGFQIDRSWEQGEGRLDLCHDFVITIDGETAKDFDDAISINKNGDTWTLGVHIADVSHFVTKGSDLDKVASRRGTSVYLIDQVVPMLPEGLSNDLCSLVEGQRRLTFSCLMTFDKDGRRTAFQFKKSVIKSRRRCTYNEVQAVADSKLDLGPEFTEKVALMNGLKDLLRKNRLAEGAVDLESTELFFEPETGGGIASVSPRPHLDSERLIEEFMLQANICAALLMAKSGDGIFRIHEAPDPEKLARFGLVAKARGLDTTGALVPQPLGKKSPNPLNRILEKVADPDERKLFSFLLLTSFMQARYSETNIGHWGLGFTHYSHFTSPIRRYPDLLAHRMLTAIVHRSKPAHRLDELSSMAASSSDLERKAVTAEREYHKLKTIRYLEDRPGERFEVMVIGLVQRGLFVRDRVTGIEGFVDESWLRRMSDEELFFDERDASFKTPTGQVVHAPGFRMTVELVGVNPERLFIDFRPVEA